MRSLFASMLLTSACTSGAFEAEPPRSMRDRLAAPNPLVVSAASTGTITARRWTRSGWVEGTAQVAVDSGEVSAHVDARGALTIDELAIALAPIELAEDVFKRPARLEHVRITLPRPVTADAQWTSDDAATAALQVDLDFDWLIAIDGKQTPLATQHLPPVALDVSLHGDGDHVDAALSLRGAGELWNWADLLQMTSLELALAAETVD